MKQIIPFKKEITFNTMISEIISISLEHTLQLTDGEVVSGEFIINGQYKINPASADLEDFYYNIPFDIAIDNDYDLSNVKIDIDDFYYEIIRSNVLKVSIDIGVDGLENKEIIDTNDNLIAEEIPIETEEKVYKVFDYENEEREKGDIMIEKERACIDNNKIDTKITSDQIKEKVKSLFDSFDDSAETFSTYLVYIVRENDTLESIMLKYSKTKDELAEYNNLDEIKIGTKLIIPASTKYE